MLDNFTDAPLTAEENETLAAKAREGDLQALEDLILGNIALVRYKTQRWISLYPHLEYLQGDMESEGLVGLVAAVNHIAKQPEPEKSNVTGFISVAITRKIGRFIAKEEVEPKRTLPPDWALADILVEPDTTEFVDFVDSLYGACDSEEHRIILRMRAEGANETEIAAVLDCSQPTICYMLDEIRQNFERAEE